MSLVYPLLGAAVAIAGFDKVAGDRGYEAMFRELGWSRESMRAVGMLEMTGGAMLTCGTTRRVGAGIVAGTSAAVLAAEMQRGRPSLARPRGLVLLAALAALVMPHRA
ncbi:MAG TPA: hypothetical protein VE650_01245 [Acetobacteraceae bacterium]|nr:hypothetical protein [Acetobacteraceae bacterium]